MAHQQVQHARGNSAQNLSYTGPTGEITVNSDDRSLRVHDGSTPGGYPIRGRGLADLQIPSSGFSYAASAYQQELLLQPAASIATGSVTMPSSANDGDRFEISTTQNIGTLTLVAAAGQVMVGPTALFLTAGARIMRRFYGANSGWYP